MCLCVCSIDCKCVRAQHTCSVVRGRLPSILDNWEKSVRQRESFNKKTGRGFTKKQKMMLLSDETRLGIRITGKFFTF